MMPFNPSHAHYSQAPGWFLGSQPACGSIPRASSVLFGERWTHANSELSPEVCSSSTSRDSTFKLGLLWSLPNWSPSLGSLLLVLWPDKWGRRISQPEWETRILCPVSPLLTSYKTVVKKTTRTHNQCIGAALAKTHFHHRTPSCCFFQPHPLPPYPQPSSIP